MLNWDRVVGSLRGCLNNMYMDGEMWEVNPLVLGSGLELMCANGKFWVKPAFVCRWYSTSAWLRREVV